MSKFLERLHEWWHSGDHHYKNIELGSEDEHELQRLLRLYKVSGDLKHYNETREHLQNVVARRIAGEQAFERSRNQQEQCKDFGKTTDRSEETSRPPARKRSF